MPETEFNGVLPDTPPPEKPQPVPPREVKFNIPQRPKHFRDGAGRYLGAVSGLLRVTEVRDGETDEVIERREALEEPKVPEGSIETPEAPPDARTYQWDGTAWVKDVAEEDNVREADAESRLSKAELKALVDTFHEMENRLRVLEGNPVQVTRSQVQAALRKRVKDYL